MFPSIFAGETQLCALNFKCLKVVAESELLPATLSGDEINAKAAMSCTPSDFHHTTSTISTQIVTRIWMKALKVIMKPLSLLLCRGTLYVDVFCSP